jgi:hypothetical protein
MQRRTMAGLLGTLLTLLSGGPVVAKGGGSSRPSGGGNPRAPSGSTKGSGTGSSPSSHPTRGYTKKDGTYVAPHQQTNPNSTTRDNYNTRGNYNPYNGQTGTKSPKD